MSDSHPTNHRLLVIDDNPAIHDDFRKIFQADDGVSAEMNEVEAELFGINREPVRFFSHFEMAHAETGQDGLALIESGLKNNQPFAVAFVDVRMPVGWDGIETASRILALDNSIQIVICTAFSDHSWREILDRLGHSDRLLILKKPFDSIEVLQLAHALSEKWVLRKAAHCRMEELEVMVKARTSELQETNARLMKEMAERASAEEALRQAQKMEALGRLAGGVAHDFNNLLTVIRGYAQCLIADGRQTSMALEALTQIDRAAERAANLTSQMLVFSRKKRLQPEYLNLNEVISQLSKMLRRLVSEDIATQFVPSPSGIGVHADRAMIEQVIMNLVVNARDAMPNGGLLSIITEEVTVTESTLEKFPRGRVGRFACMSVSDTGSGIAPEILPRLFEPFFTTKDPGKGTGLGLATVFGVVKQHEGWVDVETAPGRGSTFRVFLPICESAAASSQSNAHRALSASNGKGTVLLVEDEDSVRSLARKILIRYGYEVVDARSGAEALQIWDQHSNSVDLLLTDMVMPEGISGWALAQELVKRKPGLKVVFTTGYSLEAVTQNYNLVEGVNLLPKPYDPYQLTDIVHRRLAEAETGNENTVEATAKVG